MSILTFYEEKKNQLLWSTNYSQFRSMRSKKKRWHDYTFSINKQPRSAFMRCSFEASIEFRGSSKGFLWRLKRQMLRLDFIIRRCSSPTHPYFIHSDSFVWEQYFYGVPGNQLIAQSREGRRFPWQQYNSYMLHKLQRDGWFCRGEDVDRDVARRISRRLSKPLICHHCCCTAASYLRHLTVSIHSLCFT